MAIFIRIVIGMMLVSGALAVGAVLVGQSLESQAVIETLSQEGDEYVVSVRDSVGGMKIYLEGTRCYDPLPPEALAPADSHTGDGMEWIYARLRLNPLEAFKRLRCPR